MSEGFASITCSCGLCRISVLDSQVRYSMECLCLDCRQRAMISAHLGNDRAFPESLRTREHGIHIIYFANALQVSDGAQELLQYRKLRAGAFNTTAYARCCGTIMMSTHPAYEGQSISVLPDNCIVEDVHDEPISMRLFAGDFPADKLDALESVGTLPVVYSPYEEMDGQAMASFIQAVTTPVGKASSFQGSITYESLYAEADILIDDLLFHDSRLP